MYDQQAAYGGAQSYGNSSGQGSTAAVPAEVQGLNWGAFLLNWIWGIGNNTWLALLCFVPFINIIMAFALLFKGNEWAWQNKQWDSVEHFKTTQRKWAMAGLILIGISLLFGCLSIVLGGIAGSLGSN
ncbi:MAG TPA: hypothetical protein VIL85_10595 [Thermomicrobiales bacterium]|jgi:uncharacterized membrane protein